MIRLLATALAVTCAALAAPATGLAQGTNSAPGVSGIDEYLETVPNANGNGTVGNGQRPNSDDPDVVSATKAALPAATAEALERAGASGTDAAALAGSTAPRTSARTPLQDPNSSGPLAAAGRIVTGSSSDGLGLLFPLLIVAGTLAVAGAALRRRRTPSA